MKVTKQEVKQLTWYWVCFFVIAVPMAIIYGLSSVKWPLVAWLGLLVFVIGLRWFLKKIGWK